MAAALTEAEVAAGEVPAVAAVAVVEDIAEVIGEVVVPIAVEEVRVTVLEVAAKMELADETAAGLLATIFEKEEGVATMSEKEKIPVGMSRMVVALETGPLQVSPM